MRRISHGHMMTDRRDYCQLALGWRSDDTGGLMSWSLEACDEGRGDADGEVGRFHSGGEAAASEECSDVSASTSSCGEGAVASPSPSSVDEFDAGRQPVRCAGGFEERWNDLAQNEGFLGAIDDLAGALRAGSVQHALALARLGFNVFPVHGKLPAYGSHGFKDAVKKEQSVRNLWDRFGHAVTGVGIATGEASGVWVLDVDIANGKTGDDSLAELEATHGKLPDTVECITGTGGRHIYFQYDARVSGSAGKLAAGLDVRADGGYVVGPGSVHPDTQRTYEWEASSHPDEVDVAEAPKWLIDTLTKVQRVTTASTGEPGDMLARMATTGWTEIRPSGAERNFARPGKNSVSATLYPPSNTWPEGCLAVWTTSTDIDPGLYGPKTDHEALADEMFRELEAAIQREECLNKPAVSEAIPGTPTSSKPRLKSFDEIPDEAIEWLWPGRIPFGKITIIDGEPGVSKSTLTCDIAARASNGDAFPGENSPMTGPQRVIMLSGEDGAGDTVKPRLRSHGAEMSHVYVWEGPSALHDGQWKKRFPSFPSCAVDLEEGVNEVEAKLVVIDPLAAFFDADIMTNNDASVRRALASLAGLAQRTGAAILLVRHLNKNTANNAINRGGGSIGIIGAARSAMVAANDPKDPSRRILAPVKQNLAKMPLGSLAYVVDSDDANKCPHIRWDGSVDITADELLSSQHSKAEPSAVDAAEEWLSDYLSTGPRTNDEVTNVGKMEGHSWASIRRASARLDVTKKNTGRGTPWIWSVAENNDLAGGSDDLGKSKRPVRECHT